MDNDWLTIERDGESVNLTKCSQYAKGEVIIPDGVTTIEYDAFKDCKEVTSIMKQEPVTCFTLSQSRKMMNLYWLQKILTLSGTLFLQC